MKRILTALIILVFFSVARSQQLPTLTYGEVILNQVTGPTFSPNPIPGAPLSSQPQCNTANTSCAIQNVGMSSHVVTYCIVGGTVTSLNISLEGSNDAALPPNLWQQISQAGTLPTGANGCGTVTACKPYRYLRIHLSTLSGTSPVLTAWYSGVGTDCPGGGVIILNQPSQPITLNPSSSTFVTAKSSTVALNSGSNALYAVNVSNPNTVPVFATLTCCAGPEVCVPAFTPVVWEIPANDERGPNMGTTGMACVGHSNVACSTSASSAVDPTNSCLFHVVGKAFNVVNSQIQANGTVVATQPQTPN